MQRHLILCTQSVTSPSLNGNSCSLTCTSKCFLHSHLTTTQPCHPSTSSPKLLMSSHLASSILTSSWPRWLCALSPVGAATAQGGLGQGMRRGMYPGGGNWHCRGPARAGLACCHRQTWVWWEGRGNADVEELWERFRLRRRMGGLHLLPLAEPTV